MSFALFGGCEVEGAFLAVVGFVVCAEVEEVFELDDGFAFLAAEVFAGVFDVG